jgi:hypothetical protein
MEAQRFFNDEKQKREKYAANEYDLSMLMHVHTGSIIQFADAHGI